MGNLRRGTGESGNQRKKNVSSCSPFLPLSGSPILSQRSCFSLSPALRFLPSEADRSFLSLQDLSRLIRRSHLMAHTPDHCGRFGGDCRVGQLARVAVLVVFQPQAACPRSTVSARAMSPPVHAEAATACAQSTATLTVRSPQSAA